MNMAYAMQGGLGLPDKGYYFDADKKDKLDAYEQHVAKVLELSGVPAADAAEQADAVIAFETRLAKVSKSSEEMSRDVSLFYNPVTMEEADKLTPNFPWTKFFESQGVAAQEQMSLAIPAFHEEVDEMLADTAPASWQAYLRFHTVDKASPYLGDAFVQENYNFYGKALRGQQEIKPRWKRVLDTIDHGAGEAMGQMYVEVAFSPESKARMEPLVDNLGAAPQTPPRNHPRWKRVLDTIDNGAGEAMGQMYVEVAFSPESKARMETLVENLGAALKTRIENLEWMSDETKQKAIAKWETFTPKIGYPDKWRDWSGLSTDRDSYIGNVLAAQEFNYKWDLSKIGKPVDKAEWGMSPQTVNAYYNPLQNELVFPAAILQPPFFDPNAGDAANYGGIGAVIGHEMTHGYDDQGSRFGPTGNFENWWTDADSEGFAARTGKLVDQFNAYTTDAGGEVNGKLTLDRKSTRLNSSHSCATRMPYSAC